MKTIKVIDLLNKIANGEEVPKKIRYCMTNFKYDTYTNEYLSIEDETNNGNISIFKYIFTPDLNAEAEIIEEEKKIPEKLEEIGKIDYNLEYIDYKNIEVLKTWLNSDIQSILNELDLIVKNQNQLIDYLESKGDEYVDGI